MVITILLLCVALLFISAAERPAPALIRSPKKRD